MKYIKLKDVMNLVQREREQLKKDAWFYTSGASIKELALRHFRNILRQLTEWTEDAKEEKGPIYSDSGYIYILWIKDNSQSAPIIYGVHRTKAGTEKERDEMISEHSYLSLYLEVEEAILED